MNYKKYNDYELIYMVREKDDLSYNVLFQKYTPIIKRIALDYYKSYSTYGFDLDDFIQEGYVGFQKAVRRYNENNKALFYTFAIICIHRTLISFCNTISGDKKNISNIYLQSIDNISFSDGINYEEDYVQSMELFHYIWNIVYSFPIEIISIFELRWNHFKFYEISKLLDLPIRRCQSEYRMIIQSLQNRLSNYL